MPNTETNRIEYKQQLTEDFEEEDIAFLNYKEGGIIYVGIRKDGQVVGLKDIDFLKFYCYNLFRKIVIKKKNK